MGGYNYRAAAISFTTLVEDFPDSEKSDEYMLMVIKSYYKFAQLSVIDKQVERYEKVISTCADFSDRFPNSKMSQEVSDFKTLSETNIKTSRNE